MSDDKEPVVEQEEPEDTTEGRCQHRLSKIQTFCYSVGHALNDLCASMWFSYFILFYHKVLRVDNITTGNLILLGQVADAIGTPFFGYESDRSNGFWKYGKRKSWHLFGTVSVISSFVFVFTKCLGCGDSFSTATTYLYYTPFVCLFQFGWAATQISHLSIIPELTECKRIRGNLNGYRYAVTVASNIYVFVAFTILLSVSGNSSDNDLGPNEMNTFLYLAIIVVVTGGIFVFIFHVGLREIPPEERALLEGNTVESSINLSFTWKQWFLEPQFYVIGALYMWTRLAYNFTQVYYPLYITETLQLDKTSVAILPLVVFISGFLASLLMQPINKVLSRKVIYLIALGIASVYCVVAWFLPGPSKSTFLGIDTVVWHYFLPVLMGVGNGTLLVTVLSLISDMIGPRTHCGAIAYGCFSFLDKISNGIAIQIAQTFQPAHNCSSFYRICLSIAPACFIAAALLTWIVVTFLKIGRLRFDDQFYCTNGHVTNIQDHSYDNDLDSALLIHRQVTANSRERTESEADSSTSDDSTVEHVACKENTNPRATLEDVKSHLYAPGVFLQPSHSRNRSTASCQSNESQ